MCAKYVPKSTPRNSPIVKFDGTIEDLRLFMGIALPDQIRGFVNCQNFGDNPEFWAFLADRSNRTYGGTKFMGLIPLMYSTAFRHYKNGVCPIYVKKTLTSVARSREY